MRSLTIHFVILLGLFFPALASAVTPDARVFAYGEANYPTIFTGAATAGQYLQYNYSVLSGEWKLFSRRH